MQPGRMSDRYIFAVAVEAFFTRALGDRLDADARARLKAAGIDLGEPLLAAYPAEVFHEGVAIAASAAYPGVDPGEAQYRAGRDHIHGFVESYPGRMMLALARQLEPRTILEYTGTFLRLGNNFTECRARSAGATRIELWMNDVGPVPDWYRGIVACGLELAGIQGVQVARTGSAGPGVTFLVTWTGR